MHDSINSVFSIVAGSDYERTVNILIIPECATRICIEISTIDDTTLENIEYFSVLLSHGANIDLDSRINISNPEKQYAIIDIDSEFLFCTFSYLR